MFYTLWGIKKEITGEFEYIISKGPWYRSSYQAPAEQSFGCMPPPAKKQTTLRHVSAWISYFLKLLPAIKDTKICDARSKALSIWDRSSVLVIRLTEKLMAANINNIPIQVLICFNLISIIPAITRVNENRTPGRNNVTINGSPTFTCNAPASVQIPSTPNPAPHILAQTAIKNPKLQKLI